MKEIYNNLKKEDSLLIIKSGIFFITFEKDALIMNNIFGYMIKNNRVGFPKNSIDKVKNTLNNKNINYIIYENNECDYHNFKNNKYNEIYEKVMKNEYDKNIKKILLDRIEYLIKDNTNYERIRRFIDEF